MTCLNGIYIYMKQFPRFMQIYNKKTPFSFLPAPLFFPEYNGVRLALGYFCAYLRAWVIVDSTWSMQVGNNGDIIRYQLNRRQIKEHRMVHKNVKARMALIIGSPSSRLSQYSHLITNIYVRL